MAEAVAFSKRKFQRSSATATTAARPAASAKSCAVFVGRLMPGISYMTLAVARLISLEVGEWRRSAGGHGAVVAVVRVVAVIYVAIEATRTVEPGAGADEETAGEPVGAVVAVGSAVIGGVVEIPVRADRGWPSDADAYADLRRGDGCSGQD